MNRLDILQSQRDRLDERIAYLESLPQEPTTLDGETANVIWFEKAFRGERTYTYAAVQASDSLWYTTGPQAPKGYAWSDLIQWIQADEDSPVEVWVASEWELL